MKRNSAGIMVAVMVLVIGLSAGVALADKSAVTIEAPDQAVKGTEIPVKTPGHPQRQQLLPLHQLGAGQSEW